MGDRKTPLKYGRRRAGDILARVTRSPRGALIIYRGNGYAYVRCPGCREWYWRIYYRKRGAVIHRETPRQAYCSEPCSKVRQALLLKARHKRWKLNNPGYSPPCRRR